ncbi:MAG TPA: DUF1905 domain-containing protein [Crocinitomicaceae bacterium]|nr:DUF1905 domain-containing protein [Flavobacteriales bacterium]HBW87118.1 DUF1905 domain-containing protein [Crocinitomicaceae bacterium]
MAYQFSAVLWQYSQTGGWYFVSLLNDLATEIRKLFKKQEEGWGRMKAKAKIRETLWDTAIWYDTKLNTYILPVKADIRKKEKIEVGTELIIEILL